MAEVSGGGDPPYWGDTFVSSEITSATIKTSVLERSNDYDEASDEEKILSDLSDYEIVVGETELIAPPLAE